MLFLEDAAPSRRVIHAEENIREGNVWLYEAVYIFLSFLSIIHSTSLRYRL